MKRRGVEDTLTVSFLDMLSCAMGATVLLFLVMSGAPRSAVSASVGARQGSMAAEDASATPAIVEVVYAGAYTWTNPALHLSPDQGSAALVVTQTTTHPPPCPEPPQNGTSCEVPKALPPPIKGGWTRDVWVLSQGLPQQSLEMVRCTDTDAVPQVQWRILVAGRRYFDTVTAQRSESGRQCWRVEVDADVWQAAKEDV